MTKIKLCGLSRLYDIAAVNVLLPEYVGFVFVEKSKRYVSPERAAELKSLLHPVVQVVGVFANAAPETVAALLCRGTIDIAQLHGNEDEDYIRRLRMLSTGPIIQAFTIRSEEDVRLAEQSSADFVLLDSGAGTGAVFDWNLLKNIHRPYFLAGGLGIDNVENAIGALHPYAVDASSGVETDGFKDRMKMAEFVSVVRKEEQK
ncbi:MAG: phosphoribosylanthranilate isomerase [Clostridia bacterium]|nr:phosphoribosylanthranilate isomerase [Clostridia bacterium]